jgi:hypothetical protein
VRSATLASSVDSSGALISPNTELMLRLRSTGVEAPPAPPTSPLSSAALGASL